MVCAERGEWDLDCCGIKALHVSGYFCSGRRAQRRGRGGVSTSPQHGLSISVVQDHCPGFVYHLCNVHEDTYFWSGPGWQGSCAVPTPRFQAAAGRGRFNAISSVQFFKIVTAVRKFSRSRNCTILKPKLTNIVGFDDNVRTSRVCSCFTTGERQRRSLHQNVSALVAGKLHSCSYKPRKWY